MSILIHFDGPVNPPDLDTLNADLAFLAALDRDEEAMDRLAADLLAEAVGAADREELEAWLGRLDDMQAECDRAEAIERINESTSDWDAEGPGTFGHYA